MANPKPNPKRWYLVMLMCLVLSLIVFLVAPKLGYNPGNAHAAALMIALWAPTAAILGVRAELLERKD